ncbi:DUF6151 family protein [Parvularcula marina]|uniref:DUF6151 family protein n=1 Tax=Parvularcula marina TaxID=2292771 RepID=UPI0035164ABE
MTDLDFTCRCGEVRAVLEGASPEAGNHVKCYCRDCQAFMYFCGHEADGLDPAGGSEIYQVKATSVRFSQGADRLAAVRLTGGPLVRWYTTCCKTPVANTPMPGWLDFAGFQVMGLGPEAQLEEAMGPLLGQAFTKSARGGPKAVGGDKGLGAFFLRILGMTLKTAFSRPAKRSGFRDPETGKFIAKPEILGPRERVALYAKVDAARMAGIGAKQLAHGK